MHPLASLTDRTGAQCPVREYSFNKPLAELCQAMSPAVMTFVWIFPECLRCHHVMYLYNV